MSAPEDDANQAVCDINHEVYKHEENIGQGAGYVEAVGPYLRYESMGFAEAVLLPEFVIWTSEDDSRPWYNDETRPHIKNWIKVQLKEYAERLMKMVEALDKE